MARIRFGAHSIKLPERRWLRITLGVVLVLAGGLGGWLPILGFWMVPLGLIILSVDLPRVRRWRRKTTVQLIGWWRSEPWIKRVWDTIAARLPWRAAPVAKSAAPKSPKP